jgi:C4-type Zn-finger protein
MAEIISDRKCPSCGDNTGAVMHSESIPCTCGRSIKIEYLICECGYSWRSADGKFLDGCLINVENVEELINEVEEFFEDQNIFETPQHGGSMEELIHKCLRCGEVAVQINSNTFECPTCGFSWEMDGFNE